MGKGGKPKNWPPSPLRRGGPSLVGLKGRGVEIALIKSPVTVTIDPDRHGESLLEKTVAALVDAVKDEPPN